jgi:membrane-bound ClpP family serine protease
MNRWIHPLKLFVMGSALVMLILFTMEFFVSVGSSIHVLNLGYKNPNITLYCKDWAYVVAAMVWVAGFSVGVMGAVVNLSNAVRVSSTRVKRFNVMEDLTKAEAETLHTWLNLRTYDQSYLKELWGEYRE